MRKEAIEKRFMIAVWILIAISLASSIVFALDIGQSAADSLKAVSDFFSSGKMILNSVVLAMTMFVIYLLVIRKMMGEDKGGKVDFAQIAIYILIIVSSVMIAWKFGTGNYLWEWYAIKNFFHMKVIANSALIAVILFFVISLWFKDKITNEVKVGAILFVIFIGIYFSVSQIPQGTDYDDATYKFIWEEKWFIKGRMYLLGDEYCKVTIDTRPWWKVWGERDVKVYDDYCYVQESVDEYAGERGHVERTFTSFKDVTKSNGGFGILRGTRLFVLIGGTLLMIWLFSSGIFGQGMTDIKTRWALSIAIAATSAANGLEKGQFILIAYWTILIILARNMGFKQDGNWNTFGLGFAYGIVNTLSNNIFGAENVGYQFAWDGNSFLANFIAGSIAGYVISAAIKSNSKLDLAKKALKGATPAFIRKYFKNLHKKLKTYQRGISMSALKEIENDAKILVKRREQRDIVEKSIVELEDTLKTALAGTNLENYSDERKKLTAELFKNPKSTDHSRIISDIGRLNTELERKIKGMPPIAAGSITPAINARLTRYKITNVLAYIPKKLDERIFYYINLREEIVWGMNRFGSLKDSLQTMRNKTLRIIKTKVAEKEAIDSLPNGLSYDNPAYNYKSTDGGSDSPMPPNDGRPMLNAGYKSIRGIEMCIKLRLEKMVDDLKERAEALKEMNVE